jgi:GNAT superfamily N-acetyltransferase
MKRIREMNLEIFPYDNLYLKSYSYGWIVTVKGDDVGFCTLDLLSDGIGFLSRAGLKPEARGFNLQMRMISVRESFAKRNGYYQMITYTLRDNIKSSVNLQKCGYMLYLPAYAYAGKDCLYWHKKLV